ncbi:MAG: hypothetical protein VB042_06770 [Victivallaceae bacterium]|nr:hypothetical protein [Victivallaceae bacterium]
MEKVGNNNISTKRLSSHKGRFSGCFLAVAIGLAFFIILAVFFNWGIWRSLPYELTGVEFPIKEVYRTETSDRGRDLGFWVVVYQLPENLQTLINEEKIDLKDYPMFSGLKWDGYTRIKWTHEFPRNDAEKSIYDDIIEDIDLAHVQTVEMVSDDKSAKALANYLLNQPDTLYGGWYKIIGRKNEVWIPHYFFYIINIKKQILIMFGMDT